MKRSTTVMAALIIMVAPASRWVVQAASENTATKSLHEAASEGDLEQVNVYIANHADLNARDEEGRTPLACAIVGRHGGIVERLLDAGAGPNVASRDGLPLYVAARAGVLGAVETLVEHGAEINASDDVAGTALHGAAAMGHLGVVEWLLEAGADTNARTRTGMTPLDMAAAMQRTEVVEMLRRRSGAADGENRGRPARPVMPRGPYESAMPEERQVDMRSAYGQTNDPSAILADPNAIRRKVASFAGLADTLTALDEKSRGEQRSWQQRRVDNRVSLLRSADTQFTEELALVKASATQENARQTLSAIDEVTAKRKARYEAISDFLREERRAAILAEREASRSAMRGGRGRGRSMQATEETAPVARDISRSRDTRDPNAPPLDADTESQLQAWQGSAEDKRSALDAVVETDLRELETLRQVAGLENAARTAACIEGLMLAHQERRERIVERIAAAEEREQRLEERAATRGRGTDRGAMQGDTTMQGRGRRGR